MKGEVLLQVNEKWLKRISWMEDEDTAFIADVVLALSPAVFAPDENIEFTALFVMHAGLVISGGQLLRRGEVWGQDMLLALNVLRQRELARALSYVESFYIDRDTLLRLAALHYDTERRLRRRILYMALHRFIVLLARTQKQIRNIEMLTGTGKLSKVKGTRGKWKNTLQKQKTCASFSSAMAGAKEESHIAEMRREERVQFNREQELYKLLFRVTAGAAAAAAAADAKAETKCTLVPHNNPTSSHCTGVSAKSLESSLSSAHESWEPRSAPPMKRDASCSQSASSECGSVVTKGSAAVKSATVAKLDVMAQVHQRQKPQAQGVTAQLQAMRQTISEQLEAVRAEVAEDRRAMQRALQRLGDQLELSARIAGSRPEAEGVVYGRKNASGNAMATTTLDA